MGLIVWWVTAAGMATVLLLWVLLVVAVAKARSDTRFVISAGPPSTGAPTQALVSVVIPARNEEGSVGRAVRAALNQDHTRLEVIVVDDNSTDGTRKEALAAGQGDDRLRVLAGKPLPDGWLGKPSAVFHGQAQAQGEVLLFLDADVALAPQAVRRSLERLEADKLDMLSLWGRWIMVGFWERVAQPVVGSFIRGAHPLDRCNDPADPTVFANGQFIMIRRVAYDAFGGHDAVKAEVLEDVRFAQRASEAGLRCGMFLAPELFAMRPYESLSGLWSGYVKNFFHGTGRSVGKALAAVIFLFTTTLLPAVIFAAGVATGDHLLAGITATILLLQLVYRAIYDPAIGLPRIYGLTHLLGTSLLIGIILHSTLRGVLGKKTIWKGRAV